MVRNISLYAEKHPHQQCFQCKTEARKTKIHKGRQKVEQKQKKVSKKTIHDINEIHSSGTKRCSTEQLSSLKGACVSYRDCVLLCEHVLVCTCVFKLLTLNYFQPFTCQRRFFRENVSELAGWLTLPKGD